MEVRKTVINGREYRMLLPPVRPAMLISEKVTTMFGALYVSFFSDSKVQQGWPKFTQALQSIDPDKADSLMMESANISKLSFGNIPIFEGIEFERHFGQYREDVFEALTWCLWETVRDFFPKLDAFIQTVKKAIQEIEEGRKVSQSPKDGEQTGG
jgi:hypothetical protein